MIATVAPLLLIEPDELIAELTAFRLELLGFRVEYFHRGEDGRQRAESLNPSVILVDSNLPDYDGFELVKQFSSNSRTAGIPLLVLSVDADLHRVEQAYRAGARDYLVLPYDPIVLETKIKRLIERREEAETRPRRIGVLN